MSSLFSGQITVTNAGTAVQGPATPMHGGGFVITALSGNTGVVYIGNDGSGDVSSSTGLEIKAGESVYWNGTQLSDLWFDAATDGDKLSWLWLPKR